MQEKVGAGAHRNVALAAVALDLFQALDVEGVEPPEVTLDGVLLHLVTQLRQLILRQLPCPLVLNSLRVLHKRQYTTEACAPIPLRRQLLAVCSGMP